MAGTPRCAGASLCLRGRLQTPSQPRPRLNFPGCVLCRQLWGLRQDAVLAGLRSCECNDSRRPLLRLQAEQYVFAGLETRSLDPGQKTDLLSRPSQPMARASANNFDVVSCTPYQQVSDLLVTGCIWVLHGQSGTGV